jgi:hypothetical protein
MNCFEARQDFRPFWKKELEPQRRAALVQHLRECAKCDAAFRAFALSAPVLHSDAEPDRTAHISRSRESMRSRRVGGVFREPRRATAWLSMAATVLLLLTGVSAAYLSVESPAQTLSEAIHQPEPFVQLVSSEVPEANSDLGQ